MKICLGLLLIFCNISCMDIGYLIHHDDQAQVNGMSDYDRNEPASLTSEAELDHAAHKENSGDIVSNLDYASIPSTPIAAQMIASLSNQFTAPQPIKRKFQCNF